MNFKENVFSFLGKCLVMLSMTSMTASYATETNHTRHSECHSVVQGNEIIFMQFTWYDQPAQRYYGPENVID